MITVPCNICRSDTPTLLYQSTLQAGEQINAEAFRCTNNIYGHHPQVVRCSQCGHIYTSPRWSEEELLEAYSGVEDETYVDEHHGRELTFARYLQAVESVVGSGSGKSLLDVGAYTGVFVQAAQQTGWQAMGLEPSHWCIEYAKQHGIPLEQGTLDTFEANGRQFDVITMWDVIEHVHDPRHEIAQARSLLKPGGVLVLHTMDINTLFAKCMGRKWPWFMDMHLNYFSVQSLSDLLTQEGFTVLAVRHPSRWLRLHYVMTRVEGLNKVLGAVCGKLVNLLHLGHLPVPINVGDQMMIIARLGD